MPRTRIRYVELKTGHGDCGPAWISRVSFSRSGRSIYFRGKELLNTGPGIGANYMDVETREQYWVSGPKKNRQDRHWAGGGPIEIDEDVRVEYLKLIGSK
jgi:hypothetical protein